MNVIQVVEQYVGKPRQPTRAPQENWAVRDLVAIYLQNLMQPIEAMMVPQYGELLAAENERQSRQNIERKTIWIGNVDTLPIAPTAHDSVETTGGRQ